MGKRVDIMGAVTIAVGGSWDHLLTVPVGYRPPGLIFLGHFRATSNRAEGQLLLSSTGILSVPASFRSGSLDASDVVPLTGSWYIE